MHSQRRRVPWASLAELDQLCSWIYADEADIDAKISAVHRLSAWKNITQIPHALESTLSLLVAILQDTGSQQLHASAVAAAPTVPTFALSVRQGYATALIRLVNGLVDPLQQGVYARSIAGIAAQIGLPQWLVELRHAATHEELPSLEMLRSGARESMTWLLHNYFMPTLSPPESSNSAAAQLAPPTAILKEYKSLLKLTVRDASLKTRHKTDVTRILRDIERWIGEARIAAASVIGDVLGSRLIIDDDDAEMDPRESWALDRLCDELLGRGALVPVASKKRENPNEIDSLPKELLEIWTPLLESAASSHPTFPYTLVMNIVNTVLYGKQIASDDELSRKDKSYGQCLARWAVFVVDRWGANQSGTSSEEGKAYLAREDVAAMLLTALGSSDVIESSERSSASYLLQLLCKDRPELSELPTTLLPLTRSVASQIVTQPPDSDATAVMEERLSAFLSLSAEESCSIASVDNSTKDKNGDILMDAEPDDDLPDGWSRISSSSWKPCPIGVFYCPR